MDDAEKYGKEFYRLDFSQAVRKKLLADYKVLILTVNQDHISQTVQAELARNREIELGDAVKIIGCWNGLAKRIKNADAAKIDTGQPMRRAVAFSSTIRASKITTNNFNKIVEEHKNQYDIQDRVLECEIKHVDGTQNAFERNEKLRWLREPPAKNHCRILNNARCLSEGVDVPALDAVIFLSPRKSQVDIVQSVGRVMRRAPGKKEGYIILPIAVPVGMKPEDALADHEKYQVVWNVLQALRSHDDNFNAIINQLKLNEKMCDKIMIVSGDNHIDADVDYGMKARKAQLSLPLNIEEWRQAIYAKAVIHCGDRHYWENWAQNVGEIAQNLISRIRTIVQDDDQQRSKLFERFLVSLHDNINLSLTRENAIEMLAQHIITQPILDALFRDPNFLQHNPVAKAIEKILAKLHTKNISMETRNLDRFYDQVKQHIEGIDNAAGRQQIIKDLYENFFHKTIRQESLGIVYTPIEIVDFILHSVDDLLQQELGSGLSSKDVHILDPFTGTGTFITRLLQLDLINRKDLLRKYAHELHANELVLLAYYIAAMNIEQAFYQQTAQYRPFEGIVLTDTFQNTEGTKNASRQKDMSAKLFPVNSSRLAKQQQVSFQVILGNPPYSAGRQDANDDNANPLYPQLDTAIRSSYAAQSSARLKNSLYDSYIRAIRWASDRIENEGVLAFVSNGGFIDGRAMDGLRRCLYNEFNRIYCINLRGNTRTFGERARQEGGQIFGSGSRATIALLFLIKNSQGRNDCRISYHNIGDYLSREEKLNKIEHYGSIASPLIKWQRIKPDRHNDWINQRDPTFATYLPLGDETNKKKPGSTPSVFTLYSRGITSGRDAWAYNFSKHAVARNMRAMIACYNQELKRYQASKTSEIARNFVIRDPTKISWDGTLEHSFQRRKTAAFSAKKIRPALYRPFVKSFVYFDRQFNNRVYLQPQFFPSPQTRNRALCITTEGKGFSVLLVAYLPDLHLNGTIQCFPRYTYPKNELGSLYAEDRYDNIPATTVALFRQHYKDSEIDGDAIFDFIYGLLHCPTYTERYAKDLGKMLPRIPYPRNLKDFRALCAAGKKLGKLHINYENLEPYPLRVRTKDVADDIKKNAAYYRVHKMKFSGTDKSRIHYNAHIVLHGIPANAYNYKINGRSPLEWVVDRYQVKRDKKSRLLNDPNLWSDDPCYIIKLIKSLTRLSIETDEIIKSLPSI